MRGTVTHDGTHVVKDVKVCGGGTCEILRGGGRMAKGESEPFHLDMQTGDPVSLGAAMAALYRQPEFHA